jgi:hypothetical protein
LILDGALAVRLPRKHQRVTAALFSRRPRTEYACYFYRLKYALSRAVAQELCEMDSKRRTRVIPRFLGARAAGQKSEAVRVAVRALTRPPSEDPLLGLSGMVHGLPRDASVRFDRYLDETFRAKRRSPLRTLPKRRKSRS